jgi:hypothetical protein
MPATLSSRQVLQGATDIKSTALSNSAKNNPQIKAAFKGTQRRASTPTSINVRV